MEIKDAIGKSQEEIQEIVDQEWQDEIYSLPVDQQGLAIIKRFIRRINEAQQLFDRIGAKEPQRASRPWYHRIFSELKRIYGMPTERNHPADKAYARLIAAAPDLLEACKLALESFEIRAEIQEQDEGSLSFIEHLKGIINKAEGRDIE